MPIEHMSSSEPLSKITFRQLEVCRQSAGLDIKTIYIHPAVYVGLWRFPADLSVTGQMLSAFVLFSSSILIFPLPVFE